MVAVVVKRRLLNRHVTFSLPLWVVFYFAGHALAWVLYRWFHWEDGAIFASGIGGMLALFAALQALADAVDRRKARLEAMDRERLP